MESSHQQQITGWTHWIGFASAVMAISGIIHVIYGLGGIFNQAWYVYSSGEVVLFDITTWGWSMLAAGVLLILSASLLASGNMLGRIIGAILATAGLVANLALLDVTPIWSTIAIFINAMVLYAVLFHGKEMKQLNE